MTFEEHLLDIEKKLGEPLDQVSLAMVKLFYKCGKIDEMGRILEKINE